MLEDPVMITQTESLINNCSFSGSGPATPYWHTSSYLIWTPSFDCLETLQHLVHDIVVSYFVGISVSRANKDNSVYIILYLLVLLYVSSLSFILFGVSCKDIFL